MFGAELDEAIGHRDDVPQHIARRDPSHAKTERLNVGVTSIVTFRPIAHVVRHPVDLDHQLGGWTVEVRDIGANRMLMAKPDTRR